MKKDLDKKGLNYTKGKLSESPELQRVLEGRERVKRIREGSEVALYYLQAQDFTSYESLIPQLETLYQQLKDELLYDLELV